MISLFSRVAIAIATATLLTVFITRLALDSPPDAAALNMLRGHVQLIAETMATIPPAERRRKTEELSKRFGYPVQLEGASGTTQTRVESRRRGVFVIARVPGNPGQVTVGPVPMGHVTSLSTVVGLAIAIACLIALVVCILAVRRIRKLERVASRMRSGDFSVRAERDESDALDGIGDSLNQLADRVGQLLSDERDLLRTVAHEVRTPIARMHFRVSNVEAKATEDLAKDTEGLTRDLVQVDKLFEELLTYVAFDEFDHERPRLTTTPLDVVAAVSRVVEEVTATNDSVTVEIVGDASARVIANEKLFDRAVTNLLLNAMVYGGPAIFIDVRVFEEECVVDVQDSGPGIPETDRPKVVKPFVRLDKKKKKKGTGLGLAIVTRIMALHGGRLHIVNAPKGGASVQLVWKNADPQPRPKRRAGAFYRPRGQR